MSALVHHALEAAGLLRVLELRDQARFSDLVAIRDEVEKADWILLGALADTIRLREVGDRVRVAAASKKSAHESDERGLAFLREVSLARIFSERSATIAVDLERVGIELAEVALSFGANELCGAMRNKRGLAIAEEELGGVGKRSKRLLLASVKKRELADVLAASGKVAEFVEAS